MTNKKFYLPIVIVTLCIVIYNTQLISFHKLSRETVGFLNWKAKTVFTSAFINQSNNDRCNSSFQSRHFLTIQESRGRLGNNLFQLLTLLGMSIEHCYTPVITYELADKLKHTFNLSFISTIEKIPLDKTWSVFTEEQTGTIYSAGVEILNHNTNWSLDGYFQSWRYFDRYRDFIRSMLKFRTEVTDAVLKYTESTKGLVNKTKICIHERRGDFLGKEYRAVGFSSADVGFLNRSMTYFTNKFRDNQTVFIFISDDIKWCQKHFQGKSNVFFSPFSSSKNADSSGRDIALMSVCDHTIVTSGSFGWIGAWLAHGHVVYFKGFPVPGSPKDKRMNRYDYYPPHWEGMM